MSRLQLALNVSNLDAAIEFYSTLFNTTPHKIKPGYANFAIANPPLKLVLIENAVAEGGSINHLGVEVETSDVVAYEIARLAAAGLATEVEETTTCCYAVQDKVWVSGSDQERWEVYTVLSDSESFGPAEETACCASEIAPVAVSLGTPTSCC